MALTENEDILLVDMQNNSANTNNANIGLAARDSETEKNIGLAQQDNQEVNRNIGLAARGDELPSIENYPQVAGAMSVPSSSTAFIPVVDEINAGELNLQEKVLQERAKVNLVRDLKEAGSPNSVFGYYGSFVTEIDFDEATYDPKTKTYSDVTLLIEPNTDIPGYEPEYGFADSIASLPDGLTKEEILHVKTKMEGEIMKSGDLTYSPQSDLKLLGTVKMAETTTGPQAIRAFLNTYPLRLGFYGGKALFPKIEKGKKIKPHKYVIWPLLGFGVASTAVYKLGNEAMKKLVGADFDVQGYAQVLFAMQETELQIRGIDPAKARTLSVQQYAALLDPTFGSYWTKFANTITEGIVGTTTFLGGLGVKTFAGGGFRVNQKGELVTLFGRKPSTNKKSSNAFIVNVHQRAMDKLKFLNEERVASGLSPHIITKKRVLSEAQLILKDDKLKLKEQMPGAVFRLIYGFKETQKGALYLNKPLYYSEIAFGELGAGGLVSFESYYRTFKSSPRTEDIDKLPFLVTGAIAGPQFTGFVSSPLSPIGLGLRATSLISDFIGTGEFTKPTFDFLTGKISSLPDNMDVRQKEAVLKIKKRIGVMDQELQGDVTRSLETGIELTNDAVNLSKRMAKQFNDPSLELDITSTLGTFTGLEVIKGLEAYLVKQVMSGRATSEAMQATTEKLVKARADGKEAADKLMKKLILLGEKSGVMDNKSYMKLRSSLENSMLTVEGDAAVKHNMIMNDVLSYGIYTALEEIVENPYIGQKKVDEIVNFLKTDEGSDLKIVIGEKELDAKEAAIQLNQLAAENLDAVYRTGIDKSIIADNKNWQGNFEGVGPPPPPKFKEINPTRINEEASKHLAIVLDRRINHARGESKRRYTKAWGGKSTVEIDVADLYIELTEDVLDKIGPDSTVSPSKATRYVHNFFKKAERESMSNYLAKLGDGDSAEGLKIIKDLIKAGELKGLLTASDLNSPKAFAKAMLNENNMDTLSQKLAGDFEMKVLTPEFNDGYLQINNVLTGLGIKSSGGRLDAAGGAEYQNLLKVVDQFKTTLDSHMSDADEMLLLDATNYWKKNVLDVRETKLYQNTLGGTQNNDFSENSILGRTFANNPIKWAENIWTNIKTKGDASEFFQDFNKIFPEGTPERKMFLGALDDAAIANSLSYKLSVGTFPVKEEILPTGSAVPEIVGPKVTAVSRSALDQEAVGTVDSALGAMKQKTEWMRQASNNEYFSGSYDIFEKVENAVKYSAEARGKVNAHLKILANAFRDKQTLVESKILAKLKTANKIIQETLSTPMKLASTNNPGALVQAMFDQPDKFDAVRTALVNELGAEEARLFMRTLIGKGIHDLSTPTIKIGKTAQEKMPEVIEQYSPVKLAQLLDDNDDLLETIFDKEHLEDIKKFTKFMMRFTPDDDAVEKLQGYSGNFKRARNFNLSHASIISRVYAAESGRTSFRYIGAEAVIGVLMNSNNDVLTAIFMDAKISKELSEFLLDPTKSIKDTQGNVATWVHELTGLSQAVGGAVLEIADAAILYGESKLPTEDALIRQERIEARKEDKLYSDIQKELSGYGIRPSLSTFEKGRRADIIEIDPDTKKEKIISRGEAIEAAEDKAYDSIAPDLKEDLKYIVDEAKEIIDNETQKMDLEAIEDMQSN